ncbi:MAG TPA: amino acid adenylation domain-containing protein, partial [Thermoanaerobaculia bacterium]|nr:amino acid adenylation domain-containing protein [Thermoanaerobaculia bacterium]
CGLAESDRFALLSGLGHDPLLRDLLTPLALGASLWAPAPGDLEQPERLVNWLAAREVTVMHLTPAFGQLLAQGAAGGTAEPGGPCRPLGGPPLPALRLACFGGDQLAAEDVTRLRALAPAARLLNLYGTTETPQAMGWIEVPPAAELAARGALPVPVGRGIDGVELLVRTDRGGWAGVGELGEIIVRTLFLARGYLGDEALTRERFLPDPAGGRAGLYRTGDLGRYRPNGSLEVAGRADRQIKLRGFRIEPAEIEAALASHPAIAAAAVVAVAAAHETWLAAFVVARPGMDAPPAGELRQHLALRLPPSLLPACIAPLDRLPLTPNGKVDRRALVRRLAGAGAGAAGRASAAAAGRHRVAARDPIAEVVAGIWEEVLGSARTGGAVGPDDDFFALGGHSLLATQVLSRLGLAFAVEVPLRRLFATPTPAGLAAAVATAKAAGTAAHGEPAAGVLPAAPPPLLVAAPGGGEPPPLSFAQESLWFFEQHLPGTAAYNLPLALRLRGKAPQVAALRSALAEVARRHEALRTGFAERAALSLPGDGPVQVITPPDVLAAGGGAAGLLPLVDLSGLPAQHREPLARELAAATAAAPFTLERAPLWRARLLRLAAAEHVLLFAAHHIICDGWSIGVLAAELDALLGALAGGRPSPLPPLALQPADFARWQRRWLAGPARDALLAWWRPRFAGAPPLLELPTDRPRPVRPRHRGARIGWQLGPALSAALAGRAHRQGATPFMLLLAAFAALLGRASGQDDLVIGLSIAQRNRAELEPLIGFLVNLLALRAELRRDPPFARLLAQVRDSTLDALAHQDLPFELLVAELRPERGVAYSPLFQVLCTLQSAPLPARLAGLELEPFAFGRQAAHFDLTLSFARGEDGTIAGYLEYDVDLFDAATARRTVAHFQTLLAALAADLEHRLSELPLLGPAESHQLREWNDTAAAYPAGSCLHELIAAQARRTPEATAVAVASANDGGNGANDGGNDGDDGEQLSFAELTAAAESLAARLRAAGVGPGVLVALHLERSPALAVAVLAVLATGGAYLPLDLGEPADRLAWVLEDARPRAAVTRRAGGLAARLLAATEGGLKIVCLDEPPLESPRRPAAAPPYGASPHAGRPGLAATPDDLAYVLYTSGSTGRPKGVMVPHRALVNYLSWAVAAYEVAAGCGAPVHTPLAFDLTVTSLLAPWLAGRCALLVPESDGVDGLGRMLAAPPAARGAFSLVKLTPAHLPLLAEQTGTAAPGRTRALVVGGEALAGESLETWRRAAPATLVINEYGPTEATVGCCVHRAPAGALGDGPVPIGRPIANARLYVVDRHLRPVPLGASGELLIGGNGLARGYLRRSALTAERFVPDPFGDAPGGRLYRTGDRVRQRANGSCEYLGRYDDQVKVRGFRIEIGEVEAALLEHPRLAAAAVAAQPAPAGGKRLVAYVVPRPGAAAPAAAELRQHLAARLPEFMLPARFIPLGGLPLTGNGKVDRQALPQLAAETAVHDAAAVPAPGAATLGPDAPGASAAQGVVALGSAATPEPNAPPAVPAAAAYAPPSTPVEAALAGLWAELLRLPRVGIDDNFFELGGDSILSLQLASRARAIGIAFRSRDVFRHQTIARLAAAAAAAGAAAPAVPPAASLPDPASPAVPLLPIQRWFFDQGLAEPWHNNQAVLLSLRRPLAPPVLAAACARLVECHEALRLRFERDPGATAGWRQRIAPPPPPAALPCIDLSHLSHLSRLGGEAAAAAGVLAAAATALQGGLDLAAGPILRAARFTLPRSIGDGDATPGTRLLLVVHHLAVDGVSWRILLEDLERACTQLERGEPVRLPSPPVPFRRWAASL